MELKRDDEVRCRDYRAELEEKEKENYYLKEEVDRLTDEVKTLKECIVRMSIAGYVFNGT